MLGLVSFVRFVGPHPRDSPLLVFVPANLDGRVAFRDGAKYAEPLTLMEASGKRERYEDRLHEDANVDAIRLPLALGVFRRARVLAFVGGAFDVVHNQRAVVEHLLSMVVRQTHVFCESIIITASID